ncbi:MAG: WhiB family transcriptional regulator [Nakamurella sp.]
MTSYELPAIAGELRNPAEDPLAACIGHPDPESFFPHPAQDPGPAKAICAACPIMADCLNWATATRQSGIWGAEMLDRGKPDWANTKWRNPYRLRSAG